MAHLMMQFKRPGAPPTLDEIKAKHGLSDDDLDPNFGVVLIDPRDGTYAIRVDESAVEKLMSSSTLGSTDTGLLSNRRGTELKGPYSDPRIEPTGPPRPKRNGTDSQGE